MSDNDQPRTATDGGTADAEASAEVTEELPAPGVGETEDHEEHALPSLGSVKRWFVTTNHKDVGILYIVTSLFFLVFGGTLALLMRIQLWQPRAAAGGPLDALAYNQAVSAHGLIMVFWFISPFAFGLANYLVPLQIGAKDLSFPRLNAVSYWLYLFSGLLFGISFFQGGTFAGGWTMYAPLNVPKYMPTAIGSTMAVLALALFVASVTVSSVNFLTTMYRMRAEGLKMRKLPVFSSSILLTVWMMLFAFAALLAALLILTSDHVLGTQYFLSPEGGSLLWTHLFWFFGHPEVYIVFFPALGVMAEVFQTFTGRRLVGRKWFIASMVLVALQSFIVWMHHMFLTAINLEVKTLFMATTIGISLPFDLMVFSLIYTMIKGRIRFTTPFLFSFGALVLFIIGGITGVFLGAVVLDYEMRGTYWVVAHFHYVMVGGATALFGGLYYWYPKMTGKMYDQLLGKVHFVMYFVGFNLLYFPMFVVWETPRRVFNYNPAFTPWHQAATIGGFLLGASFLVMFYNLFVSLRTGEDVGDNPWAYATSAEWAVSSPPPLENFPGIPSYRGGTLSFLDDVVPASEVETDGGQEAIEADGGEVVEPDGVYATHDHGHDSHASIWPFGISLGMFLTFLGIAGLRPPDSTDLVAPGAADPVLVGVGGVGLVVLGVSLFAMAREPFYTSEAPIAERWPYAHVEKVKLGVWMFLGSDVILFGAFIGSYVFMRFNAGWVEGWHVFIENPIPGLMNTYLLLTSSFSVVLAMVAARKRNTPGVIASLLTTFMLGVGFLINKYIEWSHLFHEGHTPSAGIEESTFFLTTGLHALHVISGLVILLYLAWRAWGGAYLGEDEPIEYFGLYWHFVDIVWLFLFPLFYIL
ncbi:cytochrome C oxidase subunit I [Halobacteriales archaeon QS_8_69_26]|nr:MAG: cytochrome C oxidase subunit I [Halobacteriales archaeon QS_8_69_26]